VLKGQGKVDHAWWLILKFITASKIFCFLEKVKIGEAEGRFVPFWMI
jgi:hypothetical protein